MMISKDHTQLYASTSTTRNAHRSPRPHTTPQHVGPDPSRLILHEGGTSITPIFPNVSRTRHQWTKYVHINGSVYFYNHVLRIITEDDMEYDKAARKKVLRLREEMLSVISPEENDMIPQDAELIVRLGSCEEEHLMWFMSHRTMEYIAVTMEGCLIESNTTRYWTHVEEYPMHFTRLPPSARSDFLSSMAFGMNDAVMENRRSKFPYKDTQIERLMRIYEDLSDAAFTNPAIIPALVWHIARTLRTIGAAQVLYCVPHPSIPGYFGFALQYKRQASPSSNLRTWGIVFAEWLLRVMLLGSYMAYWKRLDQVREGSSVDLERFREMLRELLIEWSDSNLLATVLVGANVTFLSVSCFSSLQRTISLVSTIFAILSIIVGLYHVWHHRTKINVDIIEACKYMSHTRHYDDSTDDPADLLIMASFLCVPIASLLWSLGCFTIAIAAYCVQDTGRVGEGLLPTVLGIVLLIGATSMLLFVKFWKTRGSAGSAVVDISADLDTNGSAHAAGGV